MKEKAKRSPTTVLAKAWIKTLGKIEPLAFFLIDSTKNVSYETDKAMIAIAFRYPVNWINISAWMRPNKKD